MLVDCLCGLALLRVIVLDRWFSDCVVMQVYWLRFVVACRDLLLRVGLCCGGCAF